MLCLPVFVDLFDKTMQAPSLVDDSLWASDLLDRYTATRIPEVLSLLIGDKVEEWDDFILSSLVVASSKGSSPENLARLWAEQEVLHCTSPDVIFRESSLRLRGLQLFCSVVAPEWFSLVMKPLQRTIQGRIAIRKQTPEVLAREILLQLVAQSNQLPSRIIDVFRHVESTIKKRFSDQDQGSGPAQGVVGIALFLYFITPCVVNPFSFGVTPKRIKSPSILRSLAMVAKELQRIVNGVITSSSAAGESEQLALQFLDRMGSVEGISVTPAAPAAQEMVSARDYLAGLMISHRAVLESASTADNESLAKIIASAGKRRHVMLLTPTDSTALNIPQFCKVPESYISVAVAVEAKLASFFHNLEIGSLGMRILGERIIAVPAEAFATSSNRPVWQRIWKRLGAYEAKQVRALVGSVEDMVPSLLVWLANCGWGRATLLTCVLFPVSILQIVFRVAEPASVGGSLAAFVSGWLRQTFKSPMLVNVSRDAKGCMFKISPDVTLSKSSSLLQLQADGSDSNVAEFRASALSDLNQALNQKLIRPTSNKVEPFSLTRDPQRGMVLGCGIRFVLVSTAAFTTCAYGLNADPSLAAANETLAARIAQFGLISGAIYASQCSSKATSEEDWALKLCDVMLGLGFGSFQVWSASPAESQPWWTVIRSTVSFEALHRIELADNFAPNSPACMMTASFAASFLSVRLGRKIHCMEVKCCALGDAVCEFLIAGEEHMSSLLSMAMSETESDIDTLAFGFFNQVDKNLPSSGRRRKLKARSFFRNAGGEQ